LKRAVARAADDNKAAPQRPSEASKDKPATATLAARSDAPAAPAPAAKASGAASKHEIEKLPPGTKADEPLETAAAEPPPEAKGGLKGIGDKLSKFGDKVKGAAESTWNCVASMFGSC
jgi:hypothetical protein